MRVVPYVSVGGISFGSDEKELLSIQGSPSRVVVNRLDQLELSYGKDTYRLSRGDRKLVEVTVNSECFEIDGCTLESSRAGEVAFVELGYAIAKMDQGSFFAQGFFVSPLFGIAFDPHFPPYLTVFAKSELSQWQDVASLGSRNAI